MPYDGTTDSRLPESVRKLPKRLAALWVKAFNAAFEETENEGKAMKTAWSAVRATDKTKPKTEEKSLDLDAWQTEVRREFHVRFDPGWPNMPQWDVLVVADDHVIANGPDSMVKVAYTLLRESQGANMPEKVTAVTFADTDAWVRVVPTYTAVKTVRQDDGRVRWLGVSGGSFEDREHEVVSSGLLQTAIKAADESGDRGGLWVYHVPGTEIGTCDYSAYVDGFLLESGLLHQTPLAEKALAWLEGHPDEVGMSIQFGYQSLTPDGVYNGPGFFVERSILPASAAAFPWSGIALTEYTNMTTISEEKRRALNDILGEEAAGVVLANLQTNAKELVGKGIRFKELGGEEGELPEPVIVPEPPQSDDAAALPPVLEPESETEEETEQEQPSGEAPAPIGAGLDVPEFDYEFELSDAALDDLAERVAAKLNVPATVEKAYDPIREQVGELRTLVDALAADVARLGESEEARIVEKAANMPRATMRRILRPTQQKELEESEQATPSDARLIEIGRRTLYGN